MVGDSQRLPTVKHAVEHIVETTTAMSVSSHYWRLDQERLATAKAEFAAMEPLGIIRWSMSSWSSLLDMVEKSHCMWQTCGDYRRLNLVIKQDMYLPPHMEDLLARLSSMTVFSKLNLRKGYYQVPMAQQDVPKMAVIVPFGLFEFLRMPPLLTPWGSTCLQRASGP